MGTPRNVGLLTAPLMLVRAPVRLTLRAWEFGLSSAAEAARIGMELLDPDRGTPPPDFAHRSAPSQPETATEPEAVVPETGYVAPEPGEAGPEPDVLDVAAARSDGGPPDAPPSVPDELIPDHVDEEPVLVA